LQGRWVNGSILNFAITTAIKAAYELKWGSSFSTNGEGGGVAGRCFNLTVFCAILDVSENITELGIKMYEES